MTCLLASQLLARLQRKRAAVEKELSRVPGAPKNSKDVFQLCRGFERAFSFTVDVRLLAGFLANKIPVNLLYDICVLCFL